MKLELIVEANTPRYFCDNCYNCTSIFGRSLSEVKNRGCCYYFPKFNLVDIQNMSKTDKGLMNLDIILKHPGTKIHSYYIETNGAFDIEGYEQFKRNDDNESDFGDIRDKSIFFKTCPFVIPGKGCNLDSEFRNPVCNFFLCEEVKESIPDVKLREKFQKEAQDYWHFYDYQNRSLQMLLNEHGYTLLNNFSKVLEVLKEEESYGYEFLELKVNIDE